MLVVAHEVNDMMDHIHEYELTGGGASGLEFSGCGPWKMVQY